MTAKETSFPSNKGGRLPRKGLSAKDRARESKLGIIDKTGHVDMAVVNRLHHHSSSKNKVTKEQDDAKAQYDGLSDAKKKAIQKAAQKGKD